MNSISVAASATASYAISVAANAVATDSYAISVAASAANAASVANASSDFVVSAVHAAAYVYAYDQFFNYEPKLEEYRNYARLFAYEDKSFPYRKQAKTFNLDNPTDLNIFLDFLTDHYPEALIYSREEYFKTKLAKEYLRIIYQ